MRKEKKKFLNVTFLIQYDLFERKIATRPSNSQMESSVPSVMAVDLK